MPSNAIWLVSAASPASGRLNDVRVPRLRLGNGVGAVGSKSFSMMSNHRLDDEERLDLLGALAVIRGVAVWASACSHLSDGDRGASGALVEPVWMALSAAKASLEATLLSTFSLCTSMLRSRCDFQRKKLYVKC